MFAPVSFTPKPLSANATTLVKTGEGVLHSVVINTKGASSNTMKLYDGLDAGGTLLATIDTTSAIGTLIYDLKFLVGLTVVIGSGTAADTTTMYR